MSVKKYLDIEGLSTFLNQIKNKFISKDNIDSSLSTSSTNPVQNKVVNAAIQAVSNKVDNLISDAPEAYDTLKEISDYISTHENEYEALLAISGNKVDKVTGKGLSTNDYTTTEKNKLAGIATGAEVNQNAFSNVKVGTTTVAADSKTDTLEIAAGSNITITPDATNDKITIAATNTTYGAAGASLGLVKSGGDVTISDGVITVNDDSHNHTISNVDGLQTALDGKSATTHTHNYAGSSSVGGAANSANKLAIARTITLSGDASGSVSFDGSDNVTLPVTVADDSHNHTIANIDGLQDALDNITGGSVSSASKWTTARNINGMSVDGSANRFNYGTCSTAAATAAKTVACTGFTLATGAEITVKFTVTNTAANPTLNVNSTGAKAVYYNGAAITAGYLKANKTYTFRYNGAQYDLVGDIDTNTTYSLSSFGVTATATELNYVDGVTSSIQTQLNGKLSTTGTAAKATADANGQNIADTYIKGLSVNGRTITYTKGDGGTGTITTQDTTYTHPNSGVTAGTYKSVTVNKQGHVTAGSNPTTLAGYGITDACKLVYQTSEPSSGLVANMIWIG